MTVQLLKARGVEIKRVVITHQGMTFYATVTVEGGGEPQKIAARPSDALNLAVRAPVYVAAEEIDRAGLRTKPFALGRADVEDGARVPARGRRRGRRAVSDRVGSLSPELIRSLHPREAQPSSSATPSRLAKP